MKLTSYYPVIGKSEDLSDGKDLRHSLRGHVTAVTVDPRYRRLGVAKQLMANLEKISEDRYKAYFVDLFVRQSNKLAIDFYKKLGYIIYRTVSHYYGDEDGLDMRKPTGLDVGRETAVLRKQVITADEYD